MTPQFMTDDLGQWHAYSYFRHHYVIGISHDKAEAEDRWKQALKVAQQ